MIKLDCSPFFLTPRQEAWVHSTLSGMSREEKLRQLFCILGDAYAPEDVERLLAFRDDPSDESWMEARP